MLKALTEPRWRMPEMPDLLAVLAAGAYGFAFIYGELGHGYAFGRLTLFLPAVAALAVLLRREPLSRVQGGALLAASVLPMAAIANFLVTLTWLTALAIPAMALVAIVAARFPVATFAGVFVCASFHSTLDLYTPIPPQKAGDVLLGGLWIAALWQTFVAPRRERRPISIWPGVACVGVYVLLTTFEIYTASTSQIGFQSFRASAWYLAVVLLVAYSPWPEGTRERMEKALLGLIFATAAYATYRWAVGPTALEDQLRRSNINNIANVIRPIGSFPTAKELAGWTAIALPFAVGMALTLRNYWRVVAAAGAILAFVAMFATGVRAAPAAAVPGVIAVLGLYQVSQGYRGRRGATVAIIGLAALLGGAGAYSLTASDDPDTGNRYRAILEPSTDPNYQARLIKWRAALDDIDNAPFGHGLGTAGNAQKRFGEFVNIGSVDVDNSYIKVAYEQGFIVAVFFILTLLLLLGGLARRAMVTTQPARAGPAIAACGTLVTLLVLFFIGTYVEGVDALAAWMLVALGVRHFTQKAPVEEEQDEPHAPQARHGHGPLAAPGTA